MAYDLEPITPAIIQARKHLAEGGTWESVAQLMGLTQEEAIMTLARASHKYAPQRIEQIKKIVNLVVTQGLSHEKTAERLGITKDAVYSTLSRVKHAYMKGDRRSTSSADRSNPLAERSPTTERAPLPAMHPRTWRALTGERNEGVDETASRPNETGRSR